MDRIRISDAYQITRKYRRWAFLAAFAPLYFIPISKFQTPTRVLFPGFAKMEAENKERIETAVRRILEESDMDVVTESRIRKQAAKELDLDLLQPHYKAFVKQVVESFLQEKQEEEQQQPQDEAVQDQNYDDNGDLIICKLSDKRRVTIQDFRGKTLVSIREYYKKDGKELPTSKGISLTEEQWAAFKKNIPAIEKAIEKMESQL